MGRFGLGREDLAQKSADYHLEKFLKEQGFSIFSFDGTYFLDEDKNKYGAWSHLYSTERRERVEGGFNHHFVTRGVRQIKPGEDTFLLTEQETSCYIGGMRYGHHINFINKTPTKENYNATVVTPGATWREDGMDGGAQITIYTLLMLKTSVKRGVDFRRDETPEERRLREIEASMPAF